MRKELSASMRRATNEVLKQSVPVVDVTNRLAGWTPVGAALAGSGGLTPSAITPSASPPPSGSTANVNRAFQVRYLMFLFYFSEFELVCFHQRTK